MVHKLVQEPTLAFVQVVLIVLQYPSISPFTLMTVEGPINNPQGSNCALVLCGHNAAKIFRSKFANKCCDKKVMEDGTTFSWPIKPVSLSHSASLYPLLPILIPMPHALRHLNMMSVNQYYSPVCATALRPKLHHCRAKVQCCSASFDQS